MPRALSILLRLSLTCGLLVLFLGWVDLGAVAAALREADPRWFLLGCLAYAAGQVLNGLSWRHLLAEAGIGVSLGEMVRHDLASVYWSTVVPGGVAGEVVKGVRIARARGDGAQVATAIIAARLLGGGTAGLVGLLLLPASRTIHAHPGPAVIVLGATTLAGVAGLLLLRAAPVRLRRWIPAGRLPRLPALLRAAVATSAAHLCFAGTTAACFAAAGHPLGLPDAAWVSIATSLAELAPITLGGFGVREWMVTWLGTALVPPAAAATAALLYTAAFLGVVLAGGGVELHRVTRRGAPEPPAGPGAERRAEERVGEP